jgi:UDP-glucose 4-epimerase
MKAVVTGGAGFIGSHLADELIKSGYETVVVDNLVSGLKENIPKGARFVKKDITADDLSSDLKGADAVFHFAADPDVRSSAENSAKSFNDNVVGTFRVLEACRKAGAKRFVFASTSTVYGETDVIPTPESHPCEPISNYGASKLACEAYISSYAHTYGIKSSVLRYANIFGDRSTHGVIFDFFQKLRKGPKELEILGNGKQEKSYLFASDCVSGTLTALRSQSGLYAAYNVGSREKKTVDELARLVCSEMKVSPKYTHTGGERGWAGDVRLMLLDVSKLEALGWSEKVPFRDGVARYIGWLRQKYPARGV